MRMIVKESSAPHKRFTRGLTALGILSIILCLNTMPVYATSIPPIDFEEPEEQPEEQTEEVVDEPDDDTDTALDGDSVSDNSSEDGQIDEEVQLEVQPVEIRCTCGETIVAYMQEVAIAEAEARALAEPVTYATEEEFLSSPATVTRYEYEILKRLEFMQYGALILIGLIFILIFKKK